MIIKIFVTYCFFFKSEIMAWLVLLSNKFENVFGGSHDFIRKGELSGKLPNSNLTIHTGLKKFHIGSWNFFFF